MSYEACNPRPGDLVAHRRRFGDRPRGMGLLVSVPVWSQHGQPRVHVFWSVLPARRDRRFGFIQACSLERLAVSPS